MQTDAARDSAAKALFSALIDYAGLFPPAQLAMEPAVAEYARERSGAFAWVLGRFIVPASRMAQLAATLEQRQTFALSVILDSGLDALPAIDALRDPTVDAQSFEIAVPAARIRELAQSSAPVRLRKRPLFVESVREGDWERALPETMSALASAGMGAKVRCGGITPKSYPSARESQRSFLKRCAPKWRLRRPRACTIRFAGMMQPRSKRCMVF